MTNKGSGLLGESFRFLLVGGLNTVLTGVVFYLLSDPMPQPVAYAVAYGIGVAIASLVIPRFVFLRRASVSTSRMVAGGYLFVLLLGLALVWALGRAGLSHRTIVVTTLAVTVPLNFVVSRLITVSSGAGRR